MAPTMIPKNGDRKYSDRIVPEPSDHAYMVAVENAATMQRSSATSVPDKSITAIQNQGNQSNSAA